MFMDYDYATNRAAWAASGVRAGEPSVLRIRLIKSPGRPIPKSLRFGLGAYRLGPQRVVSNGVTIRRYLTVDSSHLYLEQYRTMKATAGRRTLSMTTADHVNPGLVLGGNADDSSDGDAGGKVDLFIDGRKVKGVKRGGLLTGDLDVRRHTLKVRLGAGSAGTMVIAYYVDVS
jgi:hypothetical protein